MPTDSRCSDMLAAVQAFRDKHCFRETGGEELIYRIELMAEEIADLLNLVMGTAISADVDLEGAFWDKMGKLESRQARMVNGLVRVSDFRSERLL